MNLKFSPGYIVRRFWELWAPVTIVFDRYTNGFIGSLILSLSLLRWGLAHIFGISRLPMWWGSGVVHLPHLFGGPLPSYLAVLFLFIAVVAMFVSWKSLPDGGIDAGKLPGLFPLFFFWMGYSCLVLLLWLPLG